MVLAIVIDQILICNAIFLVLIVVSSKAASFHNEAHTYLYQKKLGTNFLTLLNIVNRNIV